MSLPKVQTHAPWRTGILAGLLLLPSLAPAQVVINEIMADNLTAVPREGAYPDWVELYNAYGFDVSLAGWMLSDNPVAPDKYIFPAGTVIKAGSFLIVWCDGQVAKPLHASWSLSSDGETVVLSDPNYLPQSMVAYGLQAPDVSVGRVPETGGGFVYTATRPTPSAANRRATLGSPDALRVNEWMASPPTGQDDWFELYNTTNVVVPLGGLYLSDRTNTLASLTNRAIANLSFIGPNGFTRFWADNLDQLDANHTDFALSATADRVVIFAADKSRIIDQVAFATQTRDVSEGRLPDGSDAIMPFPAGRSTPGASNFQPFTNAVVNEILAHTDPPFEDAIELHNPTAAAVDISRFWLSNSKDDPKKFRIPTDTIIPAGGYVVFYERAGQPGGFNPNGYGTNRSFTLNSASGDQVYLYAASNDASGTLTGYRAGVDFGPSENGVSLGRYVATSGNAEFVPMSVRTFGQDNPATVEQFRQGTGAANSGPRIPSLVVSEIMYHPPDVVSETNVVDNELDEYIELYNRSTATVYLYDTNLVYYHPAVGVYASGQTNTWRVRGTVDFNFPTNVSLPPGGRLLIVNFDPALDTAQAQAFRTKYNVPLSAVIFGPYSGKLQNSGGDIELLKPDAPQGPDHSDFRTVPYIEAEQVQYSDTAPWPSQADGTGLALERLHPEAFGNDAANWAAANPNPGSQVLRVEQVRRSANSLVLRFQGLAGSSYSVLYRDALAGGAWTSTGQQVSPLTTSGPQELSVPIAAFGSRFFRVVTPAQ